MQADFMFLFYAFWKSLDYTRVSFQNAQLIYSWYGVVKVAVL